MRPLLTAGLACCTIIVTCIGDARPVPAQPAPQSSDGDRLAHQNFLKQQGIALRQHDTAPETAAEWQQRREILRAKLKAAWGQFPADPCPLQPRILGQLDFADYRVEKIVFQTLPDVWMTANAYVPGPSVSDQSKLPAVLCVHGHWSGAKQDPVVQSRCIGLARLGFFVLSVDAFGAGERAVGKQLGEYHGEMTGAMLLPIGKPLSGLQVYENMRAVDYLQSRPEVDPNRIGITGASGGGNQTMYAGAMDQRLSCVVPTCSVGNYQAYLSAACCMCEVVPGALEFTEEGDVLGLAVDRGLMVISATQDAFQFSVDQARGSVERANRIGALLNGVSARHTIIESPHHYNQPMREAMYGWMTLHLRGQGAGEPIPEPAVEPIDRELLRCFPENTRPDDYVTIPVFAAREGRRLLHSRAAVQDAELLRALHAANEPVDQAEIREASVKQLKSLLGRVPQPTDLRLQVSRQTDHDRVLLTFDAEAGIRLTAYGDPPQIRPVSGERRTAILTDPDAGAETAFGSELAHQLRAAGWRVVATELRATGRLAHPGDRIANAPDHNSAEWSLWVGRPLVGQWVVDLRRTLDALQNEDKLRNPETNSGDPSPGNQIAVVGIGTSGIAVLAAAALDSRIEKSATVNSLATYVSDVPYRGQRLGMMVPGILASFGDVQHIAALVAPRRLIIAGAVNGAGAALNDAELRQTFSFADQVYHAVKSRENLILKTTAADVVDALAE